MSEDGVQQIGWGDFVKVELHVGRVLSAAPLAVARKPAHVLQVDFGSGLGVRKSSAQLTGLHGADELVGRLVGVVNFPKKQIGSLMSECLGAGFHDADGNVALCIPDRDVPLGTRLL